VISMVKKAVIKILLVNESAEKTNKDIEREIFEEVSENLQMIPWAARTEKVTVTSSETT